MVTEHCFVRLNLLHGNRTVFLCKPPQILNVLMSYFNFCTSSGSYKFWQLRIQSSCKPSWFLTTKSLNISKHIFEKKKKWDTMLSLMLQNKTRVCRFQNASHFSQTRFCFSHNWKCFMSFWGCLRCFLHLQTDVLLFFVTASEIQPNFLEKRVGNSTQTSRTVLQCVDFCVQGLRTVSYSVWAPYTENDVLYNTMSEIYISHVTLQNPEHYTAQCTSDLVEISLYLGSQIKGHWILRMHNSSHFHNQKVENSDIRVSKYLWNPPQCRFMDLNHFKL